MNRERLECAVLLCAIGFASSGVAQKRPSRASSPEIVWVWSPECHADQRLGVTVRLEGKVIYKNALPICRGARSAEAGRADFHIHGGHIFQGQYRTRASDPVEGDIWQAGGEQDGLILGVSFETKRQVLLNTLHVANPNKQTSSELDRGLSITTYPVTAH